MFYEYSVMANAYLLDDELHKHWSYYVSLLL